MSSGPVRRVAWVLIAYAVGAWLVVQGAGWLRRVLALPPLFRTLGVVMLVAGVPLAVFLAWRYPELGARAEGGTRDDGGQIGRER